MKSISLLFLALVLMAIQTGCQSFPNAFLSQLQLGRNQIVEGENKGESNEELAAYQQNLQSMRMRNSQHPSTANYKAIPLGYRAGNLPCNT